MLPDYGTFHAKHIGTQAFHLFVSSEGVAGIVTTDNKLFVINFVVEFDNQPMMGTVEFLGTKTGAFEITKQLSTTGIYCQPRPDLAYVTRETNERVVPFRLYQEPEPLSQEACDRLQAAAAKRARKAARQTICDRTSSALEVER